MCDLSLAKAEAAKQLFCPGAKTFDRYQAILDEDIDAVVIATPIRTHFELGSIFLEAGKHVFIEKPLARTVEECQKLIDLAEKNRRVLMVGHVFEFNPAVQRIKRYLEEGELGKLFYIYSQRVNLGRIQSDLNALWSFAPHDISIVNYWLGESQPLRVAARGFSYLNQDQEDVVFVTLDYPSGVGVHLHLSWLDPRKKRVMTLVGSKKMLIYDDVSIESKIQLYDKGIIQLDCYLKAPESFAEFQYQIRDGDLVVPALKFGEPLQHECRHFIDCIRKKSTPMTDGMNGLRVTRVLEAAHRSMIEGGVPVDLATPLDLESTGRFQ